MQGATREPFVGIDVGTSQVRCVVGVLDAVDSGRLSVIGHGSAPNSGMRKGVVAHIDDVADSIGRAVTEAERLSGVHITRATVNVNGAHVEGIDSKGVIAVSAANRQITDADRTRAEEAATVVNFPPNREIIQFFAKNYSLDGQRNIKDPIGMQGVRLEVDAHIVTATTPNVRSLEAALEKAGIGINHRTVSSLAAAEAVLTRPQKEAGTVLLDIGAGTTNLIVIEDGEVQHVAVLPIGGVHVTNDLAIGLKTDLDVAEQVKISHAFLGTAHKVTATLSSAGKHYTFAMDDIGMITEARIDELFDYVERELHKIRRSRKLPGGVVVTGGTAKLPGIADFARDKLQLPARVGTLQPLAGITDKVQDLSFATATGLMLLDMLLTPASDFGGASSGTPGWGMVQSLMQRFKR